MAASETVGSPCGNGSHSYLQADEMPQPNRLTSALAGIHCKGSLLECRLSILIRRRPLSGVC